MINVTKSKAILRGGLSCVQVKDGKFIISDSRRILITNWEFTDQRLKDEVYKKFGVAPEKGTRLMKASGEVSEGPDMINIIASCTFDEEILYTGVDITEVTRLGTRVLSIWRASIDKFYRYDKTLLAPVEDFYYCPATVGTLENAPVLHIKNSITDLVDYDFYVFPWGRRPLTREEVVKKLDDQTFNYKKRIGG